MILRFEDFKCESSIAGLFQDGDLAGPVNEAIRDEVSDYIVKYEPQFVRDFGMPDNEYTELDAYARLDRQTDNVKNAILRRIRFSLACYVAYWWLRSQTIMPIGGVALGSENGERTSTADTQALVWNQMASNSKDLYREMYRTCPPDTEVFRCINSMGI